MATDVDFEGLDTLMGVIKATPGHLKNYGSAVFSELANKVFNESQRQVPRRTGTLAGSGSVEPDGEGGWTIGYGGAASGYAYWVHENLSAHHQPPTKAKYLEDPMNSILGEVDGALASGIDAALVGQYPQQASRAQGEATRRETLANRSRARNPTGMTSAEISSALKSIASGNRRMIRHRP